MRLGLSATAAAAAARPLPAAATAPPARRRPCGPTLLASSSRLGGILSLQSARAASSSGFRQRQQQRQPQRQQQQAPVCQAAAGSAPLPSQGGGSQPRPPLQVPPALKKVSAGAASGGPCSALFMSAADPQNDCAPAGLLWHSHSAWRSLLARRRRGGPSGGSRWCAPGWTTPPCAWLHRSCRRVKGRVRGSCGTRPGLAGSRMRLH